MGERRGANQRKVEHLDDLDVDLLQQNIIGGVKWIDLAQDRDKLPDSRRHGCRQLLD
jgi:hypothetical protein